MLWQQVSNKNRVAAIIYKNISYPYFLLQMTDGNTHLIDRYIIYIIQTINAKYVNNIFVEENGISIYKYGARFNFIITFWYNNQSCVLIWSLILVKYSEVSLKLFSGDYFLFSGSFIIVLSLSIITGCPIWPYNILLSQTQYIYSMKKLNLRINSIYWRNKNIQETLMQQNIW